MLHAGSLYMTCNQLIIFVAARPGERELDERRDAELAVEAVEDAAGARGDGRRRHIASLVPPSRDQAIIYPGATRARLKTSL